MSRRVARAAVRPGRGRRPAAEVRAAVLDATLRLLYEDGLGAVTFERVAASSGASKVTLYKWWRSPVALAFDAYNEAMAPILEFADTGDFRRDLTVQLRNFVRALSEQVGSERTRGHVIGELVGAAQSDPAVAQDFHELYSWPRRQVAIDMLSRAQRRGDIRQGADVACMTDQLWGACYHRLIVHGLPLSTEYADTLIDNLLGPAQPGS